MLGNKNKNKTNLTKNPRKKAPNHWEPPSTQKNPKPYTHFFNLLFLTAAGLTISLFWHCHCCSFFPHLSISTPEQIHGKPKTRSILIGERRLQSTGVFLILSAFMHVAGGQSLYHQQYHTISLMAEQCHLCRTAHRAPQALEGIFLLACNRNCKQIQPKSLKCLYTLFPD